MVENITKVCKKCFSFRKVINERINIKFRFEAKHYCMCELALLECPVFVDFDVFNSTFLVDFDCRIYFSDKRGRSDVA